MKFILIENRLNHIAFLSLSETIHAFNRKGFNFEGDEKCLREMNNGEYFHNGIFTIIKYSENGEKVFTSGLYIIVDRRNARITHVSESGFSVADPSLDNLEYKNEIRKLQDGEMTTIGCFIIIRGKGGVTVDELKKRNSN